MSTQLNFTPVPTVPIPVSLPKSVPKSPTSSSTQLTFSSDSRPRVDPFSGLLIVLTMAGVSEKTMSFVARELQGNEPPEKKVALGLLQLASGRVDGSRLGANGTLSFNTNDIGNLMELGKEGKVRKMGERPPLSAFMLVTGPTKLEVNMKTGNIASLSAAVDLDVHYRPNGTVDFRKSSMSCLGSFTHPITPEGEDPRLILAQLRMAFGTSSIPALSSYLEKSKSVVGAIRAQVTRVCHGDNVLSTMLEGKVTPEKLITFLDFFERKLVAYPAHVAARMETDGPALMQSAKVVVDAVSDPLTGSSVLTSLRSVRKDVDASKVSAMGGVSPTAGVLGKQARALKYVGRLGGDVPDITRHGLSLDLKETPVFLVGAGSSNITNVVDVEFTKPGHPNITIVESKQVQLNASYVPMDFINDIKKDPTKIAGKPVPGIKNSIVLSDAQVQGPVDRYFAIMGDNADGRGIVNASAECGKKSKKVGGGNQLLSEFDQTSVFLYHAMLNECAFYDGKLKLLTAESTLSKLGEFSDQYIFAFRGFDRMSSGEVGIRAYRRDLFPLLHDKFPVPSEAQKEIEMAVVLMQKHCIAVSLYRTLSESYGRMLPLSVIEELGGHLTPDNVYFHQMVDGVPVVQSIPSEPIEKLVVHDSTQAPVSILDAAISTRVDYSKVETLAV